MFATKLYFHELIFQIFFPVSSSSCLETTYQRNREILPRIMNCKPQLNVTWKKNLDNSMIRTQTKEARVISLEISRLIRSLRQTDNTRKQLPLVRHSRFYESKRHISGIFFIDIDVASANISGLKLTVAKRNELCSGKLQQRRQYKCNDGNNYYAIGD